MFLVVVRSSEYLPTGPSSQQIGMKRAFWSYSLKHIHHLFKFCFVQVESTGLATLASHLVVTAGGLSVAGGVLAEGARLAAGNTLLSSGALSIASAPASSFAVDSLWTGGTDFLGNSIQGRIAAGESANLLTLLEGASNMLFQVSFNWCGT
jgi:hypothetical protein